MVSPDDRQPSRGDRSKPAEQFRGASLSSWASGWRPARGVIRPSGAPNATLRPSASDRTAAFHLRSWGDQQPPLSKVRDTLSRIAQAFAGTHSWM